MLQLDLLFPIGLGVLLFAVHYWNGLFESVLGSQRQRVIAGVAGLTVAYLFLQLYPQSILAADAASGVPLFQNGIATAFFYIAAGFALVALIDLFTKFPKHLPLPVVGVAQLIIGVLLLLFFQFNALQGWMFLVWAMFTSIGQLAIAAPSQVWLRAMLAAAPLVGVIAAALLPLPLTILLLIQTVFTGALTYWVGRELQLHQGQMAFFLLGLIIGSVAILSF